MRSVVDDRPGPTGRGFRAATHRPRSLPGRAVPSAIALAIVLAASVALGQAAGDRPTASAAGAEPTPIITPAGSPGASADPVGDPRVSSGAPGLVGDPWLAFGAVAALGVGTLAATLAYVRLTGRPGDRA
jgi:hypothetical protein